MPKTKYHRHSGLIRSELLACALTIWTGASKQILSALVRLQCKGRGQLWSFLRSISIFFRSEIRRSPPVREHKTHPPAPSYSRFWQTFFTGSHCSPCRVRFWKSHQIGTEIVKWAENSVYRTISPIDHKKLADDWPEYVLSADDPMSFLGPDMPCPFFNVWTLRSFCISPSHRAFKPSYTSAVGRQEKLAAVDAFLWTATMYVLQTFSVSKCCVLGLMSALGKLRRSVESLREQQLRAVYSACWMKAFARAKHLTSSKSV